MKILFAGITIDRSEIELCQHLANNGVELHIACDPYSEAHQIFKNLNIPLTPIIFHTRIDFSAIRTLRQMLLTENFDIVHAVTNRSLSNTLLASRGISSKFVTYRGTVGHLSRLDPASWLTYFNPKIDKITCVSNAVHKYLASKGIPSTRLLTIHKGHDISWYDHQSPSSLSEFGIPDNALVVCFSGNMRPVKGIPVLIQALKHLPASHNMHFLIIGDVRDKAVQKSIDSGALPDFIHFTGFRNDAPALTGKADMFVMPSVSREGLCRAVIEAMAQGIPPIISNVGGMPELVVDKECGIIVPPSNPQALASAITHLAQNPDVRQKMGSAAKKRIQTHFNVKTTIKQTMDLYDELLK
ncbi:MAG: glycosyltransferase family 4 protein [Kiritimatiellae bacterium]|nr:glycosyltransferase family 4 protein [Kiritimatiellia bacterium]